MSAARRRHGRDVDGILLLDKPLALSSNQALQRVRRLFAARKAGHTGNLDVLASGLLPLCFGEATKVCQFLLDADKVYRAEFTLGRRTTTGDAEGEVLVVRPTTGIDRAALERAVASFRGPITQVPPMYSALKHHGQPLYRLALRGVEVERAPRQVTIHAFEVLDFAPPCLTVEVRCSKGTYIRTLAEDLGELLGCGAFVSALRRLAAGPFGLDSAATLEQLDALARSGPAALDALLLPADSALGSLPEVCLDAADAARIARGQAVELATAPPGGLLRLYAAAGFLGVGSTQGDGRIVPRRLFAQPESAAEQPVRAQTP